jgi:hypothetical protein
MDRSEAIVEKLLTHMGFKQIIFEPDGNVPPDFLVDNVIAVEARRLNQNYYSGNSKRGLEEISIPLWQKLEKLGHSLGKPNGESWFLFFQFSRPVKSWKVLRPKIKEALIAFKSNPNRVGGSVFADGEFEIDALKASKPLEHFFRMGGSSDQQSGGFVVSEMLSNVAHCAEEKQKKITNYRHKYKKWWLVLTDHIGQGLDDYDKSQFLTHAVRPQGWDKIIIVSPNNPTKWFEF